MSINESSYRILYLIRKITKPGLVSHVWTLTVLLYLLRTIATPLKYLFFISFGILSISYLCLSIKEYNKERIIRFLIATKEFQILGLFLVLGILLSTQIESLSVKSLINYFGISFLLLVYYDLRNHINITNLLKGWVILSFLIGILGLLKWMSIILSINIEWFSIFYENGSSLVSEYNFYACYFIISILIYFHLLHKNIISMKVLISQTVLTIFLLSIALSGSRRGLISLAALLIIGVIILLTNRHKRKTSFYKNIFSINVLFFSLILICLALVPFRFDIIRVTANQKKITNSIYRYSTLFFPNITHNQLKTRLWSQSAIYKNNKVNWHRYATFNNTEDDRMWSDPKTNFWLPYKSNENSKNLLYNGDFKFGSKFWVGNAPDSIIHEIITTKYGNAIRVSRADGKGHWPLQYYGRKIYYHGGLKYSFRFKFRVVKGSGIPFMIGWGVDEGAGLKSNLHKTLKKLDNEWYECTTSYRFKEDQTDLFEFMNSQLANTIIDFANIELTCEDVFDGHNYADQLKPKKQSNLLYNSNFRHGLEFWDAISDDSIYHKIIDTEFGKAVRVVRDEGAGGWPLAYQGRDIHYYRDLTYTFRFKFRVVKGDDSGFKIGWGWWDEDKGSQIRIIKKIIYPIGNDWFECVGSYAFEQDHLERIYTFMNNQKSNTIFDFTDIELFCNDSLNRSMYIDENIDLVREIEESKMKQPIGAERKKLLSERTTRWKYAMELWRTEYLWSNKLFGKGFDYLDKFGKKFYPELDRIDYPHNPVISSFLYSGIVGGFYYIYFLALSFWYYWKYRRHHLLFFSLYLITFAFVFISSNSHFNTPIFALLSLVPFITRSVKRST
ncbi:MAG: hypothetical protein K8R73_15615 [Clostridiales bacterium]|nr:hypothetical protein [Clostridiales bacterium]